MDFKIHINRLSKEDLEYELTIRGASVLPTVPEMRRLYRQLLRVVKASTSYTKPEHPYTYAQDSAAIKAKFTLIADLITNFAGSRTSSEYEKISTALAFITGRIDNAQPQTEPEKKERAGFSIRVAELAAQLQAKIRTLERASTQSILNTTQIGSPIAQGSSEDSSDEEIHHASSPNPNASASASPMPKAVPVASWGLKFSGLQRDISVSAFLERVAELKVSRNSSDRLLFTSAVEFFTGPALMWFRAHRDSFSSWSDIAAGLRSEFQVNDYDDQLMEEIKHRTQGSHESIGLYVSVMKNLFARLTVPVTEQVQVRILQRNILPFYQTQMGLTEVRTVAELLKYGKILEARKASVEAYVPPPMRGKTLEPDLAYVGPEPTTSRPRAHLVAASATPMKCWNCQRVGHRHSQCSSPRKRFCYRCGRPDVVVTSCPQCSGNAKRTH